MYFPFFQWRRPIPTAWNCSGDEWLPTLWGLSSSVPLASSEWPMASWDDQLVRAQAANPLARPWAEWLSQPATKRPDGQTDQNSHLPTSFLEMQKGCPRGPRRPNLVKKPSLLGTGGWAVTLVWVPYLRCLIFPKPICPSTGWSAWSATTNWEQMP